MIEWFKNMESMKKHVIRHLRDYMHARDSDTELYYMILRDYYRAIPKGKTRSESEEQFLSDLYLLLKVAPDKSSISRIRRKIQNDDGMFESTEQVKKLRQVLEWQFKDWAQS